MKQHRSQRSNDTMMESPLEREEVIGEEKGKIRKEYIQIKGHCVFSFRLLHNLASVLSENPFFCF